MVVKCIKIHLLASNYDTQILPADFCVILFFKNLLSAHRNISLVYCFNEHTNVHTQYHITGAVRWFLGGVCHAICVSGERRL